MIRDRHELVGTMLRLRRAEAFTLSVPAIPVSSSEGPVYCGKDSDAFNKPMR